MALGSFWRPDSRICLHQEAVACFAAIYSNIHPPTQAQALNALPAGCHTVAICRAGKPRAIRHRAPVVMFENVGAGACPSALKGSPGRAHWGPVSVLLVAFGPGDAPDKASGRKPVITGNVHESLSLGGCEPRPLRVLRACAPSLI